MHAQLLIYVLHMRSRCIVANIKFLGNPCSAPSLHKKKENLFFTIRQSVFNKLLVSNLPRGSFIKPLLQKPIIAQYFKGTKGYQHNEARTPEDICNLVTEQHETRTRSKPSQYVEGNNDESRHVESPPTDTDQIDNDYNR